MDIYKFIYTHIIYSHLRFVALAAGHDADVADVAGDARAAPVRWGAGALLAAEKV